MKQKHCSILRKAAIGFIFGLETINLEPAQYDNSGRYVIMLFDVYKHRIDVINEGFAEASSYSSTVVLASW
jgi:hypothetical protein